MSTRSAPIALRAVVLVSHPVTASTWPVISGAYSLPMTTTWTSDSLILWCASSARSRMRAVPWVPIFLPTMSWGVRMGFFGREK